MVGATICHFLFFMTQAAMLLKNVHSETFHVFHTSFKYLIIHTSRSLASANQWAGL
jgi:hypothetical protein